MTAGWSADRLFGAKRGPVNALFALGMFLTIGAFWMIPAGYPLMDSVVMFLIGFMIFGPQMMIGLLGSAENVPTGRAAA